MRVAGIRTMGAPVELFEVPEPRQLADDEVLIEVMAAGVGNWDEFARTGAWDVGRQPPMALGVEAAGTVLTAGSAVREWAPGDAVMTHPLPLRDQGNLDRQRVRAARRHPASPASHAIRRRTAACPGRCRLPPRRRCAGTRPGNRRPRRGCRHPDTLSHGLLLWSTFCGCRSSRRVSGSVPAYRWTR